MLQYLLCPVILEYPQIFRDTILHMARFIAVYSEELIRLAVQVLPTTNGKEKMSLKEQGMFH